MQSVFNNYKRTPVTDLIQKLDEHSVGELMDFYRPLLRELAERQWCPKLQRRYGVSDAIQNTWLAISRFAPREHFKNRRHFASFLTTSLGNQIKSLRRTLHSKKRDIAKETEFGESQPIESIPDRNEYYQLDRLVEKELACATLAVLLRQPREIQRLIRWRFRKGMTFAEIAAKIDRKADDVRYLINTCLSEMSREIRSEYILSI